MGEQLQAVSAQGASITQMFLKLNKTIYGKEILVY